MVCFTLALINSQKHAAGLRLRVSRHVHLIIKALPLGRESRIWPFRVAKEGE
jgi:hypothetical protein